jgi:glutamate-1-semialdehyde 2,1-aminomutase
LQPDALVVGKAVAGGLPCAVYGFSAGLGERMQRAKTQAPEGHSGIGTTLSANLYTLAALEAALAHLHTRHNYQSMLAGAEVLQHGFEETIHRAGLPWTITRLGARLELQFMDHTPIDAQDVRDHSLPELESHTHLFMLNRGVLLTPFHCMLLVSPATTAHHINHTQRVFEELVFSWQEAANV